MSGAKQFLDELIDLRHSLHRHPELSGQESETAAILKQFLLQCGASRILDGLGGHGLAAIFIDPENRPGPTIMLRAELDALPLDESTDNPWPSENNGCAHKCGHDGHMAILAGVARRLQAHPPTCGSVILLFQPAEETGAGALALLNDPKFTALKPDWIFALHNLPGHPTWSILTRAGAFAAGSVGVRIKLQGSTSHAAYPEQGQSPDLAMAELVMGLVNLGNDSEDHLALVTVVHARLGEANFGISPGDAEVLATIRSDKNEVLQDLKSKAAQLAEIISDKNCLNYDVEYCEEFPVTINHPDAVSIINQVAEELDLDLDSPEESPFRWSEDFGFLTQWTKGAMLGLGAGIEHPVLHGQDFDFNDDLLLPGVKIMEGICRLLATPMI